ncbi:MAG: ABC transporter substrate-binding protein [Candidatus Methylomirabilales bacterium]
MMCRRIPPVLLALAFAAALAAPAAAELRPIRIGFPIMLTGTASQSGHAMARGAELYVKEANGRGGVLGRRIELVARDTRGAADDTTRVARELIGREGVELLAGGLRAAEVLALAAVAREQRLPYVVPASKTAPVHDGRVHPFVFRSGVTGVMEGRGAAVETARLPAAKIYTIGPDDEYGTTVTRAFIDWLRRLRPDAQIVGHGWLRPSETEHAPFIATAVAARPDALLLTLWGQQFAGFLRPARTAALFDRMKVIATGEAGSPETGMALKDDLPLGITTNAHDTFYHHPVPEHAEYVERLRRFLGQDYPSSWASMGYVAAQFLIEAVQRAGSTDGEKVARALEGLTVQSPLGPLTMRARDHQATRGQVWGVTARVPEYPFPILRPVRYVSGEALLE